MTTSAHAYTPATSVIDPAAPGGIEALLEFHRARFGAAVMRANNPGANNPDDEDPDDDGDDPTGTGEDDPDENDNGPDDEDDPDEDGDEGRDDLGDKGKKALDRMKAKRKADRARIRELQQEIAAKTGDDDATQQRRETEAAATAKANKRILRSEIKAAAKGVLADPSDAFRYLDLDQFEVDEDGDVDEDEIAEAIDELVTNKPYLAAQGGRRFQGSAGGGAGKQSRPKQLTKADIDRLTPEQIVDARRKGQLDAALKGTR